MDESFPLPDGVRPEVVLTANIEELPKALGFVESAELLTLRGEIVEAIKENDWPRFHPLMNRFEAQGRLALGQQVDVVDEEDYEAAKGRIGLKVAQGLIWAEAGRPENCAAELYDAHKAARNWGFDHIRFAIEPTMLILGVKPLEASLVNPDNQPEMPSKATEVDHWVLSRKFETARQPIKEEMHQNVLYVNGKILEPSDGDAILWHALTDGRDEIRRGLVEFREHMKQLIPGAEVTLAPFEVMFLGKKKQKVLTEFGLKLKEDVIYNHRGVREEIQPFWRIVRASGFVPEVRIQGFKQLGWRVGLWARLPETVEASEVAGNAPK